MFCFCGVSGVTFLKLLFVLYIRITNLTRNKQGKLSVFSTVNLYQRGIIFTRSLNKNLTINNGKDIHSSKKGFGSKRT